jgi:hypothetical protein
MSRLNVGNLYNENEDGAPVVSGISTFSSPHYFVPPSGTTAQRPQNPGEGMIRFNTDSGHLEYYRGTHWENVIVNNNDLGGGLNGIGTTNSPQGTGTRALIIGGQNDDGDVATVEYLTISTLGESQTFGDLSITRSQGSACASRIRGYYVGGFVNPATLKNEIDSHEFSSTGNFIDYGDLSEPKRLQGSLSNSTRGITLGGVAPGAATNSIDYFALETTGITADFGNLSTGADNWGSTVASSIRGVYSDGSENNNTLVYLTISTTGDTIDFGDLATFKGSWCMSASNSTRGLFAAGKSNPGTPATVNSIEFITIATTGNAQDFGDLTRVSTDCNGGTAGKTRAIFSGGGPSVSSIIDCVEILSTGNAVDFGDLSITRTLSAACSNGHGGL